MPRELKPMITPSSAGYSIVLGTAVYYAELQRRGKVGSRVRKHEGCWEIFQLSWRRRDRSGKARRKRIGIFGGLDICVRCVIDRYELDSIGKH